MRVQHLDVMPMPDRTEDDRSRKMANMIPVIAKRAPMPTVVAPTLAAHSPCSHALLFFLESPG